jgi:subtilisin family serine protease
MSFAFFSRTTPASFCARILTAAAMAGALAVFPQTPQKPSRIDFRFQYLLAQAQFQEQSQSGVAATIRFHQPPAPLLLDLIEQLGVKFQRHAGKRLGSATVFAVELRADHLHALVSMPEIAAVQPCWRPVRVPPLDVSRPEIQAEAAWQLRDRAHRQITGKGVVIADFDTGVDFFHPMLWFADGDTLHWIDANGNNVFDAGVDAVDKNRNGAPDAGELLRYREISYPANSAGELDTDFDFLYNDVDNNNRRDFGADNGFVESTPSFGEQWFVGLDADGNRRLNSGELLVGLKTSKIRAILEADGTVRRRGVDLILANPDNGPFGGHGTSVAGIAIGGVAGIHRLAGIAPEAEMIFASISYNSSPRFFTTLPAMVAWAEAEGAGIMLYEDGEWVWEYLDGSSNEEIMLNEMAAKGIAQVAPAGNLTGGGMQKTVILSANDSTEVIFTGGFSAEVWPSLRWRGNSEEITARLRVDASSFVSLPVNGATIAIGGKSVYSNRSVSTRGTVMHILHIAGSNAATFSFRLVNKTAAPMRVEAMLGDNGFSWSGLARWNAPSETNTVTWPATADSAIGVAAYKNKAGDTNINSFSGRGVRVDERRQVDVAAPGSTVFSIGRSVAYVPFGGTSSAGPHVAGAIALLLQADPALTHGAIRNLLRTGAEADGFTGAVPNATWGAGKLRAANALKKILTSVAWGETPPQSWRLSQNYPNPFNPATHIVFSLVRLERISLKIYDLQGRAVATLVDEMKAPGEYDVLWNAQGLASGVYFYRLAGAAFSETKKLVLVR